VDRRRRPDADSSTAPGWNDANGSKYTSSTVDVAMTEMIRSPQLDCSRVMGPSDAGQMAGAISQIQTNRQIVLFENPDPLDRHSATLLHCRSPLRLERVVHWERNASRWRPAFSSHLISGAGHPLESLAWFLSGWRRRLGLAAFVARLKGAGVPGLTITYRRRRTRRSEETNGGALLRRWNRRRKIRSSSAKCVTLAFFQEGNRHERLT
jgi:hypothetical protein